MRLPRDGCTFRQHDPSIGRKQSAMPEPRPGSAKSESVLHEQTCKTICPISAAMVGVCLTTIGLLRIIDFRRAGPGGRLHRLERVADLFFIGSMILLTVICIVITYAVGTQ
jgi:hypothetical protein